MSLEPMHHSETDSLKLFKLDEMQMDTNVVMVPNSAVLPRKALRISPNESMDQKVNNKDSNRARIFRH